MPSFVWKMLVRQAYKKGESVVFFSVSGGFLIIKGWVPGFATKFT
jgi:hypothetical protein